MLYEKENNTSMAGVIIINLCLL